MKRLVIIEAKGKIAKLREIMKNLTEDPFEIIATNGRLYDLPKNEFGIDMTNKTAKEVPISESRIQKIADAIDRSEKVYIATDDDIEGEKIALDLSKLCAGKKESVRVAFNSLNKSSVLHGLQNPRPIDRFKVDAAKSKRFVDRYLGFSDESEQAVGRVLSPLLKSISEAPQKTGVVAQKVQTNHGEFQLLVELYGSTPQEVLSAGKVIESIDHKEYLIDESTMSLSEKDDTAPLWNGIQAIMNISAALDLTVTEVHQHLQELYENGRISYPRTDSNQISLESAKGLRAMAEHWSVHNCDEDAVMEKGELAKSLSSGVIQEGHEAIIPLDLTMNPYAKLNDLSVQDQVYQLILRHSLRSIKKHRIIREEKADVPKKLTEVLRKRLRDFEFNARIIRRNSYDIGHLKMAPYYNEFMPCGVKPSTSNVSTITKVIPKELQVGKIIYQQGLGRPSTFHFHASGIAHKYLTNSGVLNKKGISALNSAIRRFPEITDTSNYRKMEEIFMSSEFDYERKIADVMSIIKKDETSRVQDSEISMNI